MGHGLIWGAVGVSNGWNSEYFHEHRMLKGIWQNAISLFCKARLEGGSRTLMLRLSTHWRVELQLLPKSNCKFCFINP